MLTMSGNMVSPSSYIPGTESRTDTETSFSGVTRYRPLGSHRWHHPLTHLQIEYMVIAFDDQTKNAKLSLRQTEILAKLSKIVSDLEHDAPDS